MFSGLIGPGSKIGVLKDALDVSSTRVRMIAQRVANASTPDFEAVFQRAQGQGPEDGNPSESTAMLENEMVHLASEQIRYEMTARLLQGSYRGLRGAIRER